MFGNQGLTPEDFGASFKGFLDTMAAQTPAPEPVFCQMLQEHFGTDPAVLPVVSENFAAADHPNLQVALDDYLGASGRSAQLIGIAGEHPYLGISLAALVTRGGSALFGTVEAKQGPVQYANVTLDDDRVLACVQSGLFLIRARAAWIRRSAFRCRMPGAGGGCWSCTAAGCRTECPTGTSAWAKRTA